MLRARSGSGPGTARLPISTTPTSRFQSAWRSVEAAGTCVGAAGCVIGSQLEALAVRAIRVIVLPILGLIIGYFAGPTPAEC